MTSAVTTLLVATGVASAVWLVRTRRMQNRRVRRASADGSTSDPDSYSSDGDGWSLGSWFGHSSSHGENHSTDSCSAWDSGSGDGGGGDCGGDSGGGGDGGGGGD